LIILKIFLKGIQGLEVQTLRKDEWRREITPEPIPGLGPREGHLLSQGLSKPGQTLQQEESGQSDWEKVT
jgi:hypothetical protein